jgi:hypothetical protein
MHLRHSNLTAIFVGAVVVDVVFLLMNYYDVVFVSKMLTRWYTSLGTSAMAMDILVIGLATSFGIYLTERVVGDEPKLWQAAIAVVVVQLVHDVLFYLFFSAVPEGLFVFDVFKDYADEVGGHALWSDSLMVLGTLLLSELVVRTSPTSQTIALLTSIYLGLYALHLKVPTQE